MHTIHPQVVQALAHQHDAEVAREAEHRRRSSTRTLPAAAPRRTPVAALLRSGLDRLRPAPAPGACCA